MGNNCYKLIKLEDGLFCCKLRIPEKEGVIFLIIGNQVEPVPSKSVFLKRSTISVIDE
ncbi:MAG: hypothetical protein R2759_04870 [Bacteroidales bacterium]